MNQYAAVIFDMDGTLLDTLQDLADSMNRVLERRGFPTHAVQAYKRFVGDGMRNLVLRVLPDGAREEHTVQGLVEQMGREYRSHWADKTRLYPGIEDLLENLSRRDIRRAILSNKPHEFTVIMAEHFFSRFHFHPVLGARDGVSVKPDPAAALEICRMWDMEPKDVLYVGDTNTDMQTARRAGMYALGVLWGFRDREELDRDGAQSLIAQPQQMLEFLKAP